MLCCCLPESETGLSEHSDELEWEMNEQIQFMDGPRYVADSPTECHHCNISEREEERRGRVSQPLTGKSLILISEDFLRGNYIHSPVPFFILFTLHDFG